MQKQTVIFLSLAAVILLFVVGMLALTRVGNVYERIADSGRPFVQAVEHYRAVNGLFPIDWNDLVPAFLPTQPPRDWHLNPGYVSCYPTWPSVGISYHFNSGWSVVGEGVNRKLNVPGPTPAISTLTGQALFAAKQAEYEKRIMRHPAETVWYADKIRFLVIENHLESVREECDRAARVFPDWWFPQMALAEIGGDGFDASARFASWADEHPSYVNDWHLARHYRNKGNINEALAALSKAGACKFEPYPKTSEWTGAGLAFDSTKFSYEHKNYDLTLRLCRQWQSLGKDYGEKSWLAFQAATELANGQFDSATELAREAIKANAQQAMWAGNLSTLLLAAERRETNFIYQAGSTGSDWKLFTVPRP